MNRASKLICFLFILSILQTRAEESDPAKLVDAALQVCKEPNVTERKRQDAIRKALEAIVPLIGAESEAARKEPQHQLDRMEFAVSRPGAEYERLAYCNVVAAELEKDVTAPAKIWMLKSLERIGNKESVPIEVLFLADADETVRETARRALALNPAEEATVELRKAIRAANNSKTRIALIEALAFKRDKNDAPIFQAEALDAGPGTKTDDPAVVAAALAALAAQGIRKEPNTLEEAAELIDMGRAAKAEDIPKLLAALTDRNARIRHAAVQAAQPESCVGNDTSNREKFGAHG